MLCSQTALQTPRAARSRSCSRNRSRAISVGSQRHRGIRHRASSIGACAASTTAAAIAKSATRKTTFAARAIAAWTSTSAKSGAAYRQMAPCPATKTHSSHRSVNSNQAVANGILIACRRRKSARLKHALTSRRVRQITTLLDCPSIRNTPNWVLSMCNRPTPYSLANYSMIFWFSLPVPMLASLSTTAIVRAAARCQRCVHQMKNAWSRVRASASVVSQKAQIATAKIAANW